MFHSPSQFKPNSIITEDLLRQGIKFNSPAGDRSTRVSLRLLSHGTTIFLSTSTEGIATKYRLQTRAPNTFSILCNAPLRSSDIRVFMFETRTDQVCHYTVIVDVRSPFSYSYNVLAENREVVASGGLWRSICSGPLSLYDYAEVRQTRDRAPWVDDSRDTRISGIFSQSL
jgi:hypothetical protein